MPGSHVDVNLHPTKREVGFLHQDELLEAIRGAIEETLLTSNDKYVYMFSCNIAGSLPSLWGFACGAARSLPAFRLLHHSCAHAVAQQIVSCCWSFAHPEAA